MRNSQNVTLEREIWRRWTVPVGTTSGPGLEVLPVKTSASPDIPIARFHMLHTVLTLAGDLF